MTLRTFRRRDGFRPPAAGGFPRDGEAVTETIGRIPPWDGRTWVFTGASGTLADTAPVTRHPEPDTLPALPPAPPPRPYDVAFPVILRDGTFGLECGMDRWRIHFDPEAAHYRHMFDALRVSALRAGWRQDLYGRWCCPVCVMDPAYAAAHPLAHWHPGVPHAKVGPDAFESVRWWQQRPPTWDLDDPPDAAAAYVAGDPAAEFWLRVEAEAGVRERTAQAAVHGRHEATR